MSRDVFLGSIADFKTGPFGTQLHADEYVSDGIPIINVKNIGNGSIIGDDIDYVSPETLARLSEHTLRENDIVFARKGSIDRHAIINKKYDGCMQGSDCIRARVYNPNINPKFLSHYLKLNSVKKQLVNSAVGSTMPSMNTDILKSIEIHLPEIEVQNRIEYLLSTIEGKNSNNNAICADLERMTKLLYDYWFVQFDFPDENGKPYKSSGGKMVWNEELKREIPDGWEVNSLSEICDLSNGINYDKNEPGNKEYKIVNVRNITASSLLLNEEDFDRITLKSSLGDKYLIHDNDILIARSGTPGAIRLLEKVNDNTIYCGFIIRCSLYDKALRNYICYYLKMFEGTNATKTGGSILQNVSQETLNMIKIPMPKSDLIASFNKSTAPIIKNMQNSINENQELASLRDFLLPLLMNGQVKVKEGEKQ